MNPAPPACAAVQRALHDADRLSPDISAHLSACPACAADARLIAELDRARLDPARRRRPDPIAPAAPTAAALRRIDRRRRARDLGAAAILAALCAVALSAPWADPARPELSDAELSAALAEGLIEGLAAADPAGELPGTELIDPLIAGLQPQADPLAPGAAPRPATSDPFAPDTIDGWSL